MKRLFSPCRFIWAQSSNGNMFLNRKRKGFTIVELMVTIVIVAVIAASGGTFLVKLLTLQENEREEAYVREKLADICGAYADAASVGSSISVSDVGDSQVIGLQYRHETGGVSLETGFVIRALSMTSTVNSLSKNFDMNVYAFNPDDVVNARLLSRSASGDAHLIPIVGNIVKCEMTPIRGTSMEEVSGGTSLGYLQIAASYETNKTDHLTKTVTVGRIVRLWNWRVAE